MGTGASSQGTSSAGSRGSSNQSSEASEKSNRIQQALKQGEDLDEYSISEIAKCRLEHPKVAPSTKKKDEIFIASSHTKEAERVKNTSNLVKLSSRELVDALTEGLEDDMSKLRVIFLFIASIDLSQLSEPEDEDYSTNGPLAYLLKMKQFQGNHAHLFCALCKIAGLPCEIILGYNKSAAYQIGKPIDLKKMLAQWNAVYVCGEWRLIDCFWSCACVVGGEDESEWDVLDVDGRIVTGKKIAGSGQMTHRINEFFFLTNPEMLLATHIPKNEVWQLTPKDSVTTIETFEEEVYRRERFFELGMKVPRDDLSKCRLVADAGEITIELAITDDSPSIDFKYMLFMGKGGEDVGKLEKFVMFQRGTGSITYKASIPVKGVFKLDVFGKDSRRHKSLDLVCSYLIDAVTGSQEKEPLPDDPAIGWGPDGGYLAAYGMEALTPHDKGVIYTDTGILDIKYKMEQPLELLSLMLSNTHSKEKLGQYVYMEANNSEVGGECIIHVRLPESGVYACELFASEEGIPGELQNVCNYVIKCNKKVKNDPLPYVPNGRIGGFSMTKDLGIELLDPLNPEIITEDGKVKIKIKAPAGVKLHGAMHHPNQSTEASNKQIGMSQDGDTVTFDLDLLLSGKSCFAIYASMPGDSQVHNVCNFMIDNKAASKGKPSKSGTDLPDIETIHVRNGKAELSLTHTEAENVAACLYKDGTYLPQTPGQVTVKQDGVVSKVTIKIPEDGTYELQLHEKDKDGKSILTKKRYRLIHEGGVPDTIEEEPQEEEQHEEETMHVEEEVTANETEEDPVKAEQEKKYRELRQKLAAAIESGDEKELEATMKEFKAANVPDPNNLYERAERDLAIIRARRALNAAMNQEDTKVLQNAISQAQSIKHKGKLSSEISDAQRLLEKLKRIEKLRHAVLKLDQRTIAEIKSFATPPIVIEQVMRATLLLLGSNKKEMKDWKGVVVLIGKTGKESLKRRVMEFKVKNLKPELAAEVKTMFSKFDLIEVRDGSSGAATFYIWGMGMIEEAELASGIKK